MPGVDIASLVWPESGRPEPHRGFTNVLKAALIPLKERAGLSLPNHLGTVLVQSPSTIA